MIGMLEVLVSFIGAILLLALVSQSLIEVVKASFPIEGLTRRGSARQLIQESAWAEGLAPADGRAIYDAVAKRLGNLGQGGWRNVRLDAVEADQLRDLIAGLEPASVSGLRDDPDPTKRLGEVAQRAHGWFDLAMAPVSERYRRRMRVTNLIAAAVIVLALNVDAFALIERARTDPAFRADVAHQVEAIDTLLTRADSLDRRLRERLAAAGDTSSTALAPGDADSLHAQLDAAVSAATQLASQGTDLFQIGAYQWSDPSWWAGILLSILLVSLGAPFWHDILGTLFGLRRLTQRSAASDEPGAGGQGPNPNATTGDQG